MITVVSSQKLPTPNIFAQVYFKNMYEHKYK